MDWLCRRTEAYFRTSRRIRTRLTGSHDRHWFRVYQRHWLHTALLRTRGRYRRLLPPEMWGGHSPLDCPPTFDVARRQRARGGKGEAAGVASGRGKGEKRACSPCARPRCWRNA